MILRTSYDHFQIILGQTPPLFPLWRRPLIGQPHIHSALAQPHSSFSFDFVVLIGKARTFESKKLWASQRHLGQPEAGPADG